MGDNVTLTVKLLVTIYYCIVIHESHLSSEGKW